MQSREQIYDMLCGILVDEFEIEREDITLEASLYQDLDLDSIDAVDLVIKLQQMTGKKIQPEEFKAVRTVDDVVNAIDGLMYIRVADIPESTVKPVMEEFQAELESRLENENNGDEISKETPNSK